MKRIYIIVLLSIAGFGASFAQELKTDISVHDPVMIKQDSTYYVFSTGWGIGVWSSKDRIYWKQEKPVFAQAPKWAVDSIPSFRNHIWAPDISYYNGTYYLYYAVSAFGKNTSAIGLAINKTLNPADSAFKWIDKGMIIESYPGKNNWNAIDPNLITDKDGTPYLAFGSFWEGLKIIRLKKDRLSIDEDPAKLITLASRQKDPAAKVNMPSVDGNPVDAGGNAIEAPFIFRKGAYFYLFASIDYCCKGPKSTYKMIVGRSKKLLGPYVDENNIPLQHGGGSIVLEGDKNWYGVGHNAVCNFDGTDYLIFHGYDASDKGISKLRIEKLSWEKGWPVVVSAHAGDEAK
jgi:arabinan endo-1,5-alpha-L-arabinosidase